VTDITHTQTAGPSDAPTACDVVAPAAPKYELLAEVGRGGMGIVWRAKQTGLNRVVALKTLLGADPANQLATARFLAEAEAVAAVRHPNVIQVYDYGQRNGQPFLAMEFLPGGSLADKLRAGGRMPAQAAAELVARIAAGVAAAHDQGIVHRDLKPGNVLFDAGGEPKVADFGLAKRGAADLTRTGAVMGTPAYMAPEQARGQTKTTGPAADVYALGVILFECLSGRRPFESDDPVALMLKVAEDEPPSVRDCAPDAPRDLDHVCRRCLAKEPRDRYPTAAALADDLRRFLAGETVSGIRQGVIGRLRSNLDHARHAAEFAAYANVFFWLAGVILAGEGVVTLAVRGDVPVVAGIAANWGRVAALVGLILWYRRGRLLPATAGERYLWAVWGGYIVTCVMNGLCHRLWMGWHPEVEAQLYQTLALLTALAFLAQAPLFWGWCYAFGGAFLLAALVMAADLRWAPLEFGATWAVVLVLIGRHLRRRAAGPRTAATTAGPARRAV
jgi:hypothetical protein